MKNAFVFALFLWATVVVFAQTRPKIPETYEAHLHIFVRHNNSGPGYRGEALHAADQAKGHGLEIARFEQQSLLQVYRLQRFDLNAQYEVDSENRTLCNTDALSGGMPETWGWVQNATYGGTRRQETTELDIWIFAVGFAELELGVDQKNPNIPVFLRRNSSTTDITFFYDSFTTEVAANLFDVPKECAKVTEVPSIANISACRERAEMLKVAEAWAKAKVPYNQEGHHDGYREDCSGYVSACWALAKPGLVTSTFHTASHRITKAELKEGDILLYPADHVVLFGGWENSSKTKYYGYEETRPGVGTKKDLIPYPYYYSQSSFIPYRYNSVC